MRKPIQLVNTHYSGAKRQWRKMLSNQVSCTQQDHQEIYLAYAKSRRHFFPTKWCEILSTLDL